MEWSPIQHLLLFLCSSQITNKIKDVFHIFLFKIFFICPPTDWVVYLFDLLCNRIKTDRITYSNSIGIQQKRQQKTPILNGTVQLALLNAASGYIIRFSFRIRYSSDCWPMCCWHSLFSTANIFRVVSLTTSQCSNEQWHCALFADVLNVEQWRYFIALFIMCGCCALTHTNTLHTFLVFVWQHLIHSPWNRKIERNKLKIEWTATYIYSPSSHRAAPRKHISFSSLPFCAASDIIQYIYTK